MLPFEKDILKAITPQSCICILAKGLPVLKIMSTCLSFYDFQGSLVFILNLSIEEVEYLKTKNYKNFNHTLPTSLEKRKELYNTGGLFVLSNQTLLTDIINNNIETSKISALFVANIENIGNDSPIAFLIDLVKEHNNEALIRGFTDNPIYVNLDLVRNVLQVNKVHLYPRFSEHVQNSFLINNDYKQKNIKLSKEIEEIQILISITYKAIFSELRKEDKYNLDLKEFINDFDMSKVGLIHKICKDTFDRFGHKFMVRQLISDIKHFNVMIDVLFSIDFGCFFELLKVFWNEQILLKERSTWINTDSGLLLMDKSIEFHGVDVNVNKDIIERDLIEVRIQKIKKIKIEENIECSEEEEGLNKLTGFSNKSRHSKVRNLIELIETVSDDILILTKNTNIKDYLISIIENHFQENSKNKPNNILVITHYEFRFLDSIYKNIIFMNPSLGSVRLIEYQQNSTDNKIQNVYFLIYKDSIEEQKNLLEIRNEKDAFKKNIEAYSLMPLTTFDTKIFIDEEDDNEYEIYIDFREMRSILPYYLHRTGNRLKILTLETGDYILGKNSVVERKAISDFISSLNSGRLYFQIKMMTSKYKNVYLLIEFNGRRPCLSDFYNVNSKNTLIEKFVLIVLNFPNLQIIWSTNSLETVKIFRKIQKKDTIPTEIFDNRDPVQIELLLNIPGVDFYNYKRIMNSFESIKELAKSEKSELQRMVGKENSEKIYDFFNRQFNA